MQHSKTYKQLQSQKDALASTRIDKLFAASSKRAEQFTRKTNNIVLDFSKNILDEETLNLLLEFAREQRVPEAIDLLLAGKFENVSCASSVLHTTLRDFKNTPAYVQKMWQKMQQIVNDVHTGKWRGFSNKPITDVVNIGIGGSHLGPCLLNSALKSFWTRNVKSHFISGLSDIKINGILDKLNPETTLFIIVSKTFTTQETMCNAQIFMNWFLRNSNDKQHIAKHFIAVTDNVKKAKQFGIPQDNCLQTLKEVGGRFSVWSYAGLSVALFIGMPNFMELLKGAYSMDMHLETSDLEDNMPLIMALLSIWYSRFLDAQTHAIFSYSGYLKELPTYLQQLVMESLGKSCDRDGKPISGITGDVICGGIGTDVQHSFLQLLHQSNTLIPADFFVFKQHGDAQNISEKMLLANCFAQSRTLMNGRSYDDVYKELLQQGLSEEAAKQLAPHKVLKGNNPSNTILVDNLTPYNIGSLLALYEHKIFLQSVLLNINAFDQWGVEAGKAVSDEILSVLNKHNSNNNLDASTVGLLDRMLAKRA
ncbi:MAG: glucose-6-phosphate isomerase [Thiotrichales bacterium]|nr:MAG: glucose-6-phosphate isomerase [Thiotrichales bacterium]